MSAVEIAIAMSLHPFSALRRLGRPVVETILDALAALRRLSSAGTGRSTKSAATRRSRILVIDEHVPDARFGAGYPRAAQMIHALCESGREVWMYPMIASRADHTTIRERFDGATVRFIRSRGLRGLRRVMREHREAFDVVLVSRPENMRIYSGIRARLPDFSAYCIYDAEAIFVARDFRRRAIYGPPMSAEAYEDAMASEVAATRRADALITVTEAEADLFRARTTVPVHVVKHSCAVRHPSSRFTDRKDFLFVGRCTGSRSDSPNVDSLYWFIDEVMPLIDETTSDYRLMIVGRTDPDIVTALASDRVVFLGVIDELDGIYDACRVFVAPTRFAAGIPLKVVEAAATGIPCVVTALLAQQLDFLDGREVLAGDTAVQFADACIALYRDLDTWARIRDGARARVIAEYSEATFRSALLDAMPAADVRQ